MTRLAKSVCDQTARPLARSTRRASTNRPNGSGRSSMTLWQTSASTLASRSGSQHDRSACTCPAAPERGEGVARAATQVDHHPASGRGHFGGEDVMDGMRDRSHLGGAHRSMVSKTMEVAAERDGEQLVAFAAVATGAAPKI